MPQSAEALFTEDMDDETAERIVDGLDEIVNEENTGVNRLSEELRRYIAQSCEDKEALRKATRDMEAVAEGCRARNGKPKDEQ